jgi:predicted ATP-dependent serine protease
MKIFFKIYDKERNIETIFINVEEEDNVSSLLLQVYNLTNLKETDKIILIFGEEQIKDHSLKVSEINLKENCTLTIIIETSSEKFELKNKKKEGTLR